MAEVTPTIFKQSRRLANISGSDDCATIVDAHAAFDLHTMTSWIFLSLVSSHPLPTESTDGWQSGIKDVAHFGPWVQGCGHAR
ncbi:hypothetical protein M378DRAFT_170594 [Amanita muscaria Koide BX008]|uniref:Uncharacterized protein n=1 Tax=Amanita muscaria (strain Koide BX008) TaxID=946122 RepID=A0A0C2SWE5_AMAMK|nr:hypothetical protein M378DRAFT_170594 [Amanita muscaria Koide BX008]